MTDSMPRPLPQYVYRERTRHKRIVFYFRKGKERRIRLPDFGTLPFNEAYHAALMALEPPKPTKGRAGSLQWLIERYRETAAYLRLSYATRRQRDNIFKGVVAKAGLMQYSSVRRATLETGRDDRVTTPAQARNFLDAMRGLFGWAAKVQLVATNPALGVENPPRQPGPGFAAWTEDDVLAYEVRWPEGTRERVWLHVLLYTGLRRGDAVRIGRQHVRTGMATLITEKTGEEVNIVIRPTLARTLATGPTGDLAFVVGKRGEPLTKETFGNMFKAACEKAGVNKSAHGVRKIAATRAAEAGATVAELEAMFAWRGGTMASHYTRTVDRKRLAMRGADKMEGILPAPSSFDSPHQKIAVIIQ